MKTLTHKFYLPTLSSLPNRTLMKSETDENPLLSKKGNTLIELIIFLVILSIGITLFVPITDTLQKRRLSSTTDQLISDLQLTQNLSITAKDDLAHGINFYASSYEIFSKLDEDPINITKVQNLPNSITLYFPNDAQQITFTKKQGRLPENIITPIELQLKTSKFQTNISINTNGVTNFTPPIRIPSST